MARTLITPSAIKKPYVVNPGDLTFLMAPADPVNGNYFFCNGFDYTMFVAFVKPPEDIWNAQFQFTVGEVVCYSTVDDQINYFECIQANTGMQPDTNPTYWKPYTGETFTITSVPDNCGRTGDLTNYAVAINSNAVVWIPQEGWMQPDGSVWVQPSSARLMFGIAQF